MSGNNIYVHHPSKLFGFGSIKGIFQVEFIRELQQQTWEGT